MLMIQEETIIFPCYNQLWLFNGMYKIDEISVLFMISYLLQCNVNSVTKFWFVNMWRCNVIPLDVMISLFLFEFDRSNNGEMMAQYMFNDYIVLNFSNKEIEWMRFIYNELVYTEQLELEKIIKEVPELTKKYMLELLERI